MKWTPLPHYLVLSFIPYFALPSIVYLFSAFVHFPHSSATLCQCSVPCALVQFCIFHTVPPPCAVQCLHITLDLLSSPVSILSPLSLICARPICASCSNANYACFNFPPSCRCHNYKLHFCLFCLLDIFPCSPTKSERKWVATYCILSNYIYI